MRINIAPKLFLGFLVIILLNAFFVLIVSKLGELTAISDMLERQNDVKNQLLQISTLHKERERNVFSYRNLRYEESIRSFMTRAQRVDTLIESMRIQLETVLLKDSLVSEEPAYDPQIQQLIHTFNTGVKKHNTTYVNAFKEYAEFTQKNQDIDPPRLESKAGVIDSASVQLREGIDKTSQLLDYQTKAFIAEIERRISNMRRLTQIIVVGISIFSLVFGLFFSRAITNSLRRLRESTSAIAKGEFDFNPRGYPRDEIGDLAQAFFDMAHDLKKAQEELIRSKRLAAIGEVVASVNHEINNPLMIISGNAQFLEMSMEGYPEELKERVRAILEETERISLVTRKLREIRNPVVEDYTSSGEQMINLDKSSL
jgi:HAMP domain-containing protein